MTRVIFLDEIITRCTSDKHILFNVTLILTATGHFCQTGIWQTRFVTLEVLGTFNHSIYILWCESCPWDDLGLL